MPASQILQATTRHIPVGQAAKLLGVSHTQVRLLVERGELDAFRTSSNGNGHRRISVESIKRYSGEDSQDDSERIVVLYSRTSTASQLESLASQRDELREWSKKNVGEHEEILELSESGSGISMMRPKFNTALEKIFAGKVSKVVCTFPDRFLRGQSKALFGLFEKMGTELIAINSNPDSTPDEILLCEIQDALYAHSSKRYSMRALEKVRLHVPDKYREEAIRLFQSGMNHHAVWTALKKHDDFKCERTGRVPSSSWISRLILKWEDERRGDRTKDNRAFNETELGKFFYANLTRDKNSWVRGYEVKAKFEKWCRKKRIKLDKSGFWWRDLLSRHESFTPTRRVSNSQQILGWKWKK